MPRGGSRKGTGTKKGQKRGPYKKTRERQKVAQAAESVGVQPKDIMLEVMRNAYTAGNTQLAFDAARAVAPYVHPKLAAITHKGDEAKPVRLVEKLVIVHADSHAPAQGQPGASALPE